MFGMTPKSIAGRCNRVRIPQMSRVTEELMRLLYSLFDAADLVFAFFTVWVYLIQHYGNPESLATIPMYVIIRS